MEKIKVLMVDDHRIVLEGISSLLSKFPDIDIISKEDKAEDAIRTIEELKPDVVITDLNMPDYHGNELIRMIRSKFPNVKIVVLSMHTEYFAVHNAMSAGAAAYVQKTCSAEDLYEAIRSVLRGETYFDQEIQQIMENNASDDIDYDQLTDREAEVLKLIVDGLNSTAIGAKLHISSRTVDNHRAHMMKKLGVKNTAELVKIALIKQIV